MNDPTNFFPHWTSIQSECLQRKCLKRSLIPFIREKYWHKRYVIWLDLASSHYSNSVQNYLLSEKVEIEPTIVNPANVPKASPIEDFWGCFNQKYD